MSVENQGNPECCNRSGRLPVDLETKDCLRVLCSGRFAFHVEYVGPIGHLSLPPKVSVGGVGGVGVPA